jgi:ribonuclease Z
MMRWKLSETIPHLFQKKNNTFVKFELQILGSSSAVPVKERALSAQVLNVHDKLYLIDCGEGTQFQLQKFRISHSKIDHIFISHLHGDHIYGLPGLLNTMNLNSRMKKLNIFSPVGLQDLIDKIFGISEARMNFEISYYEVNTNTAEKIFENSDVEVNSFPLDHRIPAVGYKFTEKGRLRNIDPEVISRYNLNYNQIMAAKYGNDIEFSDGTKIKNKELTLPPKKLRSFAYCSDTRYHPDLVNFVRYSDLIFHESTYLDDMKEKARERFHSTAFEAAMIASMANAGKLVLGHFSSRYINIAKFREEAQQYFSNVELAEDGKIFQINSDKYETEF